MIVRPRTLDDSIFCSLCCEMAARVVCGEGTAKVALCNVCTAALFLELGQLPAAALAATS